MQPENLNAREALEQLVDDIDIRRGGLRLSARFHDGKVVGRVTLHAFRVPASRVLNVRHWRRQPVDTRLLEQAVAEMELDRGRTKLIVEYVDRDGRLVLHWLDYQWQDRAA